MLSILAAISFSVYFTEIAQLNKKLKLDFKPFNCTPCLAAWSGLGFYLLPDYITGVALSMFASGILAPIVIYLITFICSKLSK